MLRIGVHLFLFGHVAQTHIVEVLFFCRSLYKACAKNLTDLVPTVTAERESETIFKSSIDTLATLGEGLAKT